MDWRQEIIDPAKPAREHATLYTGNVNSKIHHSTILVSTVTIFSSKILTWLIKATMFEFCRFRSYVLPRRLDELLLEIILNVSHN